MLIRSVMFVVEKFVVQAVAFVKDVLDATAENRVY